MAVTGGELDRRTIFHKDRSCLVQNRSPGCLYNKIIKTKSQDPKQVYAFRARKHNRFNARRHGGIRHRKAGGRFAVSFFAAVMLIIDLATMLLLLFGCSTVDCARRQLDVETVGDHWQTNSEKAELDNVRYNDLESTGWQQLRFIERQIKEQPLEYCIAKIVETINKLGGVLEEDCWPPIRNTRGLSGWGDLLSSKKVIIDS